VAKVGTSKAGGTISQQAVVHSWLAADAHGNKHYYYYYYYYRFRVSHFLGMYLLTPKITQTKFFIRGRYTVLLRVGQFRVRTSVEARNFPLLQTGCGTYPSSFTMGTGATSREVKRPWRGVDHPPPSTAEVKHEYISPLLPLCSSIGMIRGDLHL
jgi:hypothetical protein